MNPVQKENKFQAHYNQWAQPLFRFIYFKSKDQQLAEDIVQDAFVKFWDKMDTVESGKEKSYLFTTARNLLLNTIEHKKVVQRHQDTTFVKAETTTPHYDLEVSEFQKRLERAIAQLSDKQREVFLLHRVEGYKYKEISELLNLSQKAVEKRMSQALKELRKICHKI
ncbi:MAG: RNA polymerase sigma-70 factor [Bacteroidota bacterium]